MATYTEIYNLRYSNEAFAARAVVACTVSAKAIFQELATTPNHANRLIWAKAVVKDAIGEAAKVLWGVIANATIQANGNASTDAQIQTALDAVVDIFAQP